MGFEKIIDFLLSLIEDILPCFTVKAWQETAVLRFGRYHRSKGPGLYWKFPFFDNPVPYSVVTTTITTKAQTVLTKDGKSITIRQVIKYKIIDVKLMTTEIYDADDAILDLAQGLTMNQVNGMTFSECANVVSISNDLTKKLRNEVKKYGIYIEQQTITDFIETRNYRLFNDSAE